MKQLLKIIYVTTLGLSFTVYAEPNLVSINESLKSSGNYPVKYHRLSDDEEKELLKDVEVPEGFTKTLFAPWQMANYPTYLAAAPNGDLYVSSDGNASGGRAKGRGRILRLRDIDGDGRADEVKEFVKDIDSPRGIIWDHDRLYVLHPPHITVFHDKDNDGLSESSERLISNIAFNFKDRSADHTTNGLEMGIDGWIYVAVGDFGFMKAKGTDGQELQLRGGGVVRFRPNGSCLELFSSGTRNIYGLAITPTLEMISRDNTNDGGGWDVRLHQHSGLEDHGYPRLYMNFKDEVLEPIADYGGGSGVGAFYLGEPGIPDKWNNRPYTLDWGRQGSYCHLLTTYGTVLKEEQKPNVFIKMTRPTDADVDGMSHIYQASWKGPASYFWKGVHQGYIARVSPKNYKAKSLPNFRQSQDHELVSIIENSLSHVRRLSAQRLLLRRPISEKVQNSLLELALNKKLHIDKRVTALYTFSQQGIQSSTSQDVINQLTSKFESGDLLMPFVVRALGDMALDWRGQGKVSPLPVKYLRTQLKSKNPKVILESVICAARQGLGALELDIIQHLKSRDPLIFHTAFQALSNLKTYGSTINALNDHETRNGATFALMRMHDANLVDLLISKLNIERDLEVKKAILSILARLYHKESIWQGDSWSTRPDSRGPYYQLSTWEKSGAILKCLNQILKSPESRIGLTSHLVSELGANRIQNDQGLKHILDLAQMDSSLLPTVLNQLADKGQVPVQAISLIVEAAKSTNIKANSLKQAVQLLVKMNHPEVYSSLMSALSSLLKDNSAAKIRSETRKVLFNSSNLENHVDSLIKTLRTNSHHYHKQWSAQILLHLASSKGIGKEVQSKSREFIDKIWVEDSHKANLCEAAHRARIPYLNDRIPSVLSHTNKSIQGWAKAAARSLRIQTSNKDITSKISLLSPEQAMNQVSSYTRGDANLGEAIFTRATCMACHTTSQGEMPKGPYLGNIANILRQEDLIESILKPNESISQGFGTQMIYLKNGQSFMGFVTDESGDSFTLRDISSKEHVFKKTEVVRRKELSTSLMPPGLMNNFTVHEFASLIKYLQKLPSINE